MKQQSSFEKTSQWQYDIQKKQERKADKNFRQQRSQRKLIWSNFGE